MSGKDQNLSVRRHGDRWAIALGDEVVLVSPSRQAALSVAAAARVVLERSGLDPERRSFAKD